MCNCNKDHLSPLSTDALNLDRLFQFPPYEVNNIGIQIPELLIGKIDKVVSNVVCLYAFNPVFIEVKNTFRKTLIQNGGYSSLEKIILELFNQHVFPSNETFSEILEKIIGDYLIGLTWGFLSKQYSIYNASEYPMVISLFHEFNYQEVASIGYSDGQKNDTGITPLTSYSTVNCGNCCKGCSSICEDSCDRCCNYDCGRYCGKAC